MSKVAKNLFLDPTVIEHGAEYGRQHGTTLSRLVSDFLRGLPLEAPAHPVSPTVQRLLGAALPKDGDIAGVGRQDYHDHLATKYGSR